MTWTQMTLVAGSLFEAGFKPMAVWIFVCFTTCYRPSDMFTLSVGDFLKPTRKCPSHALQLHPQELSVASKVGQFDDGALLGIR